MTLTFNEKSTITAQATAPGRGGVGIIRVSGPEAKNVAQAILGKVPEIRKAEYLPFTDANNEVLDQGIAIFFSSTKLFYR